MQPTISRHSSALSAKVEAVNLANAETGKLFDLLAPVFAPLVGCKILKADGTLLESVKKTLPALPNAPRLTVYRTTSSSYSLAYRVKTCINYGDHFCTYHENTVYVGDLDGQTLKAICPAPTGYRTDWTEAEVSAQRAAVANAKQALRDAEAALHPFGEYDR